MPARFVAGEDASYIPASGQRWYYRLSQSPSDDWYWQLLDGDRGEPLGQMTGPFTDRASAFDSAEHWIDAHQHGISGAN